MTDSLADPAAVDSLPRRWLRRLPLGNLAEEQLDRLERRLLAELKRRLDRLERAAPPAAPGPHEAGRLLQALLRASSDQTRDDALAAWHVRVLKSLVPDEARILSALSDGSVFPVVHVVVSVRLGTGGTRPVLENVSNVGKLAGVLAPELTSSYIQHLRGFGLVTIEAEDEAQALQYELLSTHALVRATLDKLAADDRKGQVVRRSLRLSEIGAALWKAARVSEDSQPP